MYDATQDLRDGEKLFNLASHFDVFSKIILSANRQCCEYKHITQLYSLSSLHHFTVILMDL